MTTKTTNITNPWHYRLIYAFEIPDESHKGLIKVGDTTFFSDSSIEQLNPNSKELNEAARKRINEYTQTAATPYNLLHTELAIRPITKDNITTFEGFRDYSVHEVLKNSGIKQIKPNDAKGKEWFKADIDTIKYALDSVKKGLKSLPGSKTINKERGIILRPEQNAALKFAKDRLKKKTIKHVLWNAKMRFGKTLTALQVIKDMKYQKVIIITHRPVVKDSWFEDYMKIFSERDNYLFGSKDKGNSLEYLNNQKDKNFIYFASMQDLRGSEEAGGKFDKNHEVFSTDWDLAIIDEAHEGTTTELGKNTLENLIKENTKVLYLSGTPFNIQDQFEDEETYVWDYVSEQKAKLEWNKDNYGDTNPYADLPALKMYTYNLQDSMMKYLPASLKNVAFNFREFFKTEGEDSTLHFVHEDAVKAFLDLLVKKDENSNYPFATEEFRNYFKHSFWIVPGVNEAKALKNLMEEHPVFGSGYFKIINVAGDGDKDLEDGALIGVKDAIEESKTGNSHVGTITISCGRLTTGVTVPEWTAVFMLAGSYSTSPANYLQTIFRVQSPATIDGKVKEYGYVFDFAPDRALKMVSEAVSVTAKPGKTKNQDRTILGDFLNFCPVISISGSKMKAYRVDHLLQTLKRAYAERIVLKGFDDNKLYSDELLKLDNEQLTFFKELEGTLKKAGQTIKKGDQIDINAQGLTEEEYEEVERIENKNEVELTEEEKELLNERRKALESRRKAIATLRGISIRMPLLIYGANINIDDDITLDKFTEIIDDKSWEEFMPNGVTKETFDRIKKFYDEDIFIEAGRNIRYRAMKADELEPTERVKSIAELFSYFKNPDKETVLTPWRVVNMQLTDTLGGWKFFDENNKEILDEPVLINRKGITHKVYNKNSHILELNSKTGLYPLFATYSIYRQELEKKSDITHDEKNKLWKSIVASNIYVVSKTEMAKSITKRTLLGFNNGKYHIYAPDHLIEDLKDELPKLTKKLTNNYFWNKKRGNMKFNAVIGNPPYSLVDGGANGSAQPTYQLFMKASKKLNPDFISLIIPARWYTGGKSALDDFREEMLNDKNLRIFHDIQSPATLFSNTNIRGGLCYFLWQKDFQTYSDDLEFFSHKLDNTVEVYNRSLKTNNVEILVRDTIGSQILEKVISSNRYKSLEDIISTRKPFGLDTTFTKSKNYYRNPNNLKSPVLCYGKDKQIGYVERDSIKKNTEEINSFKVFIPRANNIGTELPDDNLNSFIGQPNEICTETYFLVKNHLNTFKTSKNLTNYLQTKFVRFLHKLAKTGQDCGAKTFRFVPMEDFSKQWDDEKLYKKYNLTQDEINYIETTIKPMG